MEEEYKPIYQIEEDLKSNRIRKIIQRRKEWDMKKGINIEETPKIEKTVNLEFPALSEKKPIKNTWIKKSK
jgi:hypothetical protein